ncbi:hypothetical protein [Gordonia sp. ABSL49_1]|uniref:hypothetical protein n=1 Tax=unclassified Gordonia (in: high G+C Gram-positive bacteria) TaxID=2657482 RepID=UPI001F0FD5C5|nr:hypothetical protein [Gordonia sp. ABSL49_1]MCH5643095.1 hypothetical protein [Gordonia sp. ABSL49_1]
MKLFKLVVACVFTVIFGLGLAAAPAHADVSVRSAKTADLYVRTAAPGNAELEKQFAALWNPNIPMANKLEVSYRGNTPKVRAQVQKALAYSRQMDFFSITGRSIGAPTINGNRMTMTGSVVMAGFPAKTSRYHYIRDAGLWKIDWKVTCQELQCNGNPDFGY